MPESFDAFYARTVGNVTSQMHALAGGDSAADHAIREAYARAYQQWYEVAGFRDTEEWVLNVAREAYERRRPEAARVVAREEPSGQDSLSWPGLYRAAPAQAASPPGPTADPESTLAPQAGSPASAPAASASLFAGAAPGGVLPDWAAPADVAPGTAGPGDVLPDWATQASSADMPAASDLPATAPAGTLADRFRRPGRGAPIALLGSRRNLIAAAVAIAVVVAAVIVYAATGSSGPGQGATPGVSASAVAKPTVHMLPAGRTGGRGAIPWSLIGPGWTLAELSTAHPDANGAPAGSGRYITYLVDPEGGRYRIRATSGSAALDLLAWSGNSKLALYSAGSAQAGGARTYGLLTLATGQLTSLRLPANVTAVGFTQPQGLNIVAVRQTQAKYRLERYSLAGAHAATLSSLPRPAGQQGVLEGNALSSPDGDTVVWGASGDEMQLVSNAGGLIRRLHVPGSGTPPSCTPISWWSSDTILAYCNAASSPGAGRLWLVRDTGSSTPLTGVSGSASGSGDLTGAWQSGSTVYVTSTTAAQCQTAASGPGGQQILRLGQGDAEAPVSVPDSMNHHATVVAGVGARLLVLAQTSCPGTSSLIWFNPSTHAAQTVLTAPSTEVGVVAAVPFGSGPAATTNGLN